MKTAGPFNSMVATKCISFFKYQKGRRELILVVSSVYVAVCISVIDTVPPAAAWTSREHSSMLHQTGQNHLHLSAVSRASSE